MLPFHEAWRFALFRNEKWQTVPDCMCNTCDALQLATAVTWQWLTGLKCDHTRVVNAKKKKARIYCRSCTSIPARTAYYHFSHEIMPNLSLFVVYCWLNIWVIYLWIHTHRSAVSIVYLSQQSGTWLDSKEIKWQWWKTPVTLNCFQQRTKQTSLRSLCAAKTNPFVIVL